MVRGLLLGLCLSGALCTPARAGSLRVDPIQITISDDRRAASLTITNEGAEAATLRIMPMVWSQRDGADVHEPTSELIVSPPIVTVQAGAKQTVRVGFRNQTTRVVGSYRLILEETPRSGIAGVQVVLRLNLPLFARIAPGDASSLQWSSTRNARGEWLVEAKNVGDRFVRLTSADVAAATGLAYDKTFRLGVVLPHSSRRWIVGTAPVASNPLRWREIVREENEGERPALAQKVR